MVHPLSSPTSFLLATTLSFFLAPASVSAHRNLPRRPQPHPRVNHQQQLEERLLPITATTTVVVQKTATYTVWVKPTDQVIFPGSGSEGGSGSGNGGDGSSSSAAESSITASASASATAEATVAPSGETSETYPTASFSSSSSLSASLSYDQAAASSSASASYSASSSSSGSESGSAGLHSQTYISDSAFPSSSLASASISGDPSVSYTDSYYSSDYGYPTASVTGYATGSASESASTESSSASVSASASASHSQSGSHSHGASITGSASASATESVTESQTDAASSSSSDSISSSESDSSSASSATVTGTASLTSTASVSAETAPISANETSPVTETETESTTSSSSADESVTSTTTAWWETASATATATTSGNLSSWTESLSDTESIVPTASSLLSVTASLTATSTSAAATASSTSTLETLPRTLMNAYYPDWSGWYLPPESVDWSRFDVIDFAFALPTAEFGLQFTQDDSADLLNRLVKTAHAAGKRVKLSIGGWTGSVYFSTICASATNRKTFINAILDAYNLYNLDGIDIDWEYPGTTGADGNAVSSSDSANFLLLLQELRTALPDGALISLATQVWPFADSNGSPMSDVSAFASVIDWILIMNYDVWGSSSTPGPNAPLSDGCGNSTQPLANAYAAVSSWTGAGMPASKITLGVPAYGYLQKSTASSLKQRRSSFPLPPHKLLVNSTSHQARGSYATVYNDNGGSSDGQVMFESLISQGALTWEDGGYVGGSGFTRHWDSCSSTPWLKSEHSGQIITYDDPQSMNLKGQFAAQVGLRGCNIFSLDGDWTGSSWPLTDSVRSGLGL
ncbi:hypothetical protein I316_00292 [Kwoniella heveanensis BCC8398]|uniref:GH18 domain-containing protein n=1 Tax=Kwoniella heveanensis BCC8398 TaxID=1296120 RepID=A0A1B9H481_9TREE|nr:hypothetical protein I316_00292 [Kwoniella heveanensis BCC8398]